MLSEIFAYSASSLPIYSFRFSGELKTRPILVLGGVHGDEPEGVMAAWFLIEALQQKKDIPIEIVVVPQFNPDGLFSKSRLNGHSVDLNRNLPTKDWSPEAFSLKYPPGKVANSEPENQALTKYLADSNPRFLLTLHSFEKTLMNTNGDCQAVAQQMQKMNDLPIEDTIGYPTPGCLGTYAGLERDTPTITYEIKRGLSAKEIRKTHASAITKGLENVV